MNARSTIVLLAVFVTACSGDADKSNDPSTSPEEGKVTITWTEHGVPHVRAASWEDAAFGAAYAFARDRGCTLADQMVKVRSERAYWFGPGEDGEHIDSDFAFLHLGYHAHAARSIETLDPELRGLLEAYAAGFAAYLEEVGPNGLPSPCRGAEWVQPFDAVDLLAYYLNLGGRSSGVAVAPFVATPQPPNSKSAEPVAFDEAAAAVFRSEFPDFRDPGYGSNGWAIGADRSESGRGMVLSNTHFPTQGDLQWHEMHIAVEGESDVYGVSLPGVFPVNIGFNDYVSWTHTVSPGPRLIGYRLDLDPTDPTRYRYDGDWRQMESQTYTIRVRQPDGSFAEESRTLWRSHYGPILDVPPVGWAPGLAISFRDGNAANLRMQQQWFEMNRARSLDDIEASFRDVGGIPWVHTIAADADGNVLYADASTLPNISEAAAAQHAEAMETDVFTQAASDMGFYLVDGSDPVNEWIEVDPERPGLVPYDEAPAMRRRDYVANSNDNHWLSNPDAPLRGYHYLYGGEDAPLLLPRTRTGLMLLTEDGPDSGAGDDGRWSVDELLATAVNGRAVFADLLLEPVIERCRAAGDEVEVEFDGATVVVDLQSDVCDVLAAWDGRLTTASRGAALWRQAIAGSELDDDALREGGWLFAEPFDPERPVATPRGLAPAPEQGVDPVIELFATARVTLDAAGIDPAAPLGDVQFLRRGDRDFPVPGGLDAEGAFAIADYRTKDPRRDSTLWPPVPRADEVDRRSQLTTEGWVVNAGNTWVMAMEYTDEGPRGQALMTYGQSEDPESEHFDDQAAAYTRAAWRSMLVDAAAIDAAAVETVELRRP